MGARAVAIKQADISRAIRAVQAAGLPVMRVVVKPEGVVVETAEATETRSEPWDHADDVRAPADKDIVL